jgi:hypothetical protein
MYGEAGSVRVDAAGGSAALAASRMGRGRCSLELVSESGAQLDYTERSKIKDSPVCAIFRFVSSPLSEDSRLSASEIRAALGAARRPPAGVGHRTVCLGRAQGP